MKNNQLIIKTISVDEYIEEYNPYFCPKKHMNIKEPMCGLKIGRYDCKTCWGIAMGDVKEVDVIYKPVDFKFIKVGE